MVDRNDVRNQDILIGLLKEHPHLASQRTAELESFISRRISLSETRKAEQARDIYE